jgi:hypothetical protein
MGQTLNGKYRPNDVDSYAWNVGQWRTAIGNYNFTDDAGAQGTFTVFTVTGDVYVQVFGLCQVALTSGGAATIELGISGNTAALIAQTTATDLDQYETWQDAGPEANPGAVPLDARGFVIANGANVILTVATADPTAGDIDFICRWWPISTNGNVVAA